MKGDVLVLRAMRWPDEIRDPAELLPPPVRVSDEEVEDALDLMAALQESVTKAEASRGEDTGPAEVHELPAAKK